VIGIPNHGGCAWAIAVAERRCGVSGHSELRAGNPAPRAREGSAEAKHLRKALESLAEEGVTQVFKPEIGSACCRRGGAAAV
jgi:peptide chain release factor 3